MKAPYEWPPTATAFLSATPSSTTLSMAASALDTSCLTYVSLGSSSPSPMMGKVGPSRMAYFSARNFVGTQGRVGAG